jgi:tRNA pseudouridine55 synthase
VNINGIINVLKPPGMTSHDVVIWLRKTLNIKKTGHGGTLDPYAAGVLPIFIGRATKAVQFFEHDDKEYVAEILFGVTTETGDVQGAVTANEKVRIDRNMLTETLNKFIGKIEQIPPMYSAVHHKGKRLYELARQGITVERKPRIVDIKSIELLDVQDYKAILRVNCSKGTYIRTLCEDIGKTLGCGACLSSLVRIRSGHFHIGNSLTIEEITGFVTNGEIESQIIYIDDALKHLPKIKINLSTDEFISKGTYVGQQKMVIRDGLVRVYDCNDDFVGIADIKSNRDDYIHVRLIKSLR